eukprot:8982011-Pyramimonas_sp.AAC.1
MGRLRGNFFTRTAAALSTRHHSASPSSRDARRRAPPQGGHAMAGICLWSWALLAPRSRSHDGWLSVPPEGFHLNGGLGGGLGVRRQRRRSSSDRYRRQRFPRTCPDNRSSTD